MNNAVTGTVSRLDASAATGRAGIRERMMSRWFSALRRGRLVVEFPSGARSVFEGATPGPNAFMRINNLRLVTRMMTSGDMGFAESYMAGDWDTPDLAALLTLGMTNSDELSGALRPSRLRRWFNRLYHACHANSRRGSRRNIAAHYDLGNHFYGLWLDETMSYSSALFDTADEDMVRAQRRKYLRLAEKLALRSGDRVLEIGCGWGGFAEIGAAEFGCHVTALTLSVEQAAYARERIARAGLADRVDIRIQDYRDISGTFDKIASIEMFEAVGEAYWPTYLNVLRARLAPGGRAGLQIITIDDGEFESYRQTPDFIQRYIFPGGMLPGPRAFARSVERAGLTLSGAFCFGKSYAETLRRWDRAFMENWSSIEPLGFDDRFRRMWHYYLAYCEVGFDLGRIDVGHFIIDRPIA